MGLEAAWDSRQLCYESGSRGYLVYGVQDVSCKYAINRLQMLMWWSMTTAQHSYPATLPSLFLFIFKTHYVYSFPSWAHCHVTPPGNLRGLREQGQLITLSRSYVQKDASKMN